MLKSMTIPLILGSMMVASHSFAQKGGAPADEIAAAVATIETLVTQLQTRTEGYPAFIAELQEGLVTIEQADERVAELIASLRQATTQLEDDSEVDRAIDDYLAETEALIAEADGSDIQMIRDRIPALRDTAAALHASDQARAEMVIEARNLIRTLEQDQEALAFLVRANQVQQAAALIAANLSEFNEILDAGTSLSTLLLGTVPR